jgi:hypothetical protein
VREATTERTQPGRHPQRLAVQAVPVPLPDLDHLSQGVLDHFLDRFLGDLAQRPGGPLGQLNCLTQQAFRHLGQPGHQLAEDLPPGRDDRPDQRRGERRAQRPDDFRTGEGNFDQDRVLGVLDVQRLLPQRVRLVLRHRRQAAAAALQLLPVPEEVPADRAADVVGDVADQLVEALTGLRQLRADGVPLGRHLAHLVFVALRPVAARNDVEDPVEVRRNDQAHELNAPPGTSPGAGNWSSRIKIRPAPGVRPESPVPPGSRAAPG